MIASASVFLAMVEGQNGVKSAFCQHGSRDEVPFPDKNPYKYIQLEGSHFA